MTFTWPLLANAQTLAIVSFNDQFPVLKKSQAKMLYRGKLTNLASITPILADLPSHSATRTQFYETLLGKSPAQMQSIWARLSFAGRSKPPFELQIDNPATVLEWLTLHPNGIAYLNFNDLPDDIHILYTMKVKD